MGKKNIYLIGSVFLVFLLATSGMLFGGGRGVNLKWEPADVCIKGVDYGAEFGSAVVCGDINGDGYVDIIIGAPYADPGGRTDAGAVYVVFGSRNLSLFIDLSTQSADIIIYGVDAGDNCGYAMSSGNVNGDGYADIIIGAPGANPPGGEEAGETYVIFGGSFPSPPYTVDLNTQSADITIYGKQAFEQSGYSVASGNVNNDLYDDVIIGAPGAFTPAGGEAGETYVVFGGSFPSPPYTIDLDSQSADITIVGDDSGGQSGWAVASGNVNGDLYDDVIIGAPYADPPGGNWAGKTYVIFGGSFPSPPYTIELWSQPADVTVYGNDATDCSGYSVASGNVNGDSYGDIIIGAPYADPPGGNWAGETYVIFGSSLTSPPYTIDLDTQSADITIYGKQAIEQSGHAVASGNVNGDLYDDVIIGAPYAGQPEAYRGWVSTILGSSSPLSTTHIGVNGDEFNCYTGWSVAIGDVNGDGYGDLIMGALGFMRTYVIFGGGPIIVAHGEGGDSWVALWDTIKETKLFNKKVFGAGNINGEVHVAMGDVNGDGEKELICGHGYGGSSWVSVYKLNGARIFNRKVFGSGNTKGEVHVGAGDIDGDRVDEIICGQGRGGASWVKVYRLNGTVIFNKEVFGAGNSQGEVRVGAGDIDGDGDDDIICGQGFGGSSWVKVYRLNGTVIFNKGVFGAGNTQGEVNVGAGNVDGDGDDDIICGHGYGGSSWVKFYYKIDVSWYGMQTWQKKVFGGSNTHGEVHVGCR